LVFEAIPFNNFAKDALFLRKSSKLELIFSTLFFLSGEVKLPK